MISEIKILSLRGSHKEIGRAHGEELRESIAEFIALLHDNVLSRSRVKLDDAKLSNLLRKHQTLSIEYAPDLNDELLGIAQGANQDIDKILLLNSFLDILNLRDSRQAATLLGCTTFAATPDACVNSRSYVGQNYDMEAFYSKFMVVLDVDIPDQPRSKIFSYAGVLGCSGLNVNGIGLCINFLHSKDSTNGVMYPFVVRNILRQERIGDALGASIIGYRAGGINYLIGSDTGLVFCVETSARDHDILYPESGIIAHTNHYISSKMQKYDLMVWDSSYDSGISRRGSTVTRWVVANKMLKDNRGNIDLTFLKRLAANKTNYPFSVCCHAIPTAGYLAGETNASMIFDLIEKKMHIAPGKPCETEYLEIAF